MADDKFLRKLHLSNLHFYSVGIVARDKEFNSDYVDVFPIEVLTDKGGDITKIPDDDKITVPLISTNDNTKPETIVIKPEHTIRAKWLSFGQYNRITSPDVRKGEQVLLYRFSNSDLWFWTTMLNKHEYRTEEVVIYAWSDKKQMKEDNELIDDMYYLEVNTKDKFIKLHTTDKNGEYTTYDFILDTKNGNFKFIDGKNNYIELDSPTDTVTINTNNELDLNITNTVNVNTTDTNINSSNSINTTTTTESKQVNDSYSLNVSNNVSVTSGSNTSISAGGNASLSASGSVSVSGGGGMELSGSGVSLLDTLIELVEDIIQEQHVGNLGIDTNLTSDSKDRYQQIIAKLKTIKGQ